MSTQLTAEDKSMIFAMHTNAEQPTICHCLDNEDKTELMLSGISNFNKCVYVTDMDGGIEWHEDFSNVVLHLYDLSDITKEHAIEIIKIDRVSDSLVGIADVRIIRERTRIIYNQNGVDCQINLSWNMLYPFADKLRKLGYMLPYKGINLFDAGIAIRKTKTT